MGKRYHDPDAMINSRTTAINSGAAPFTYSKAATAAPNKFGIHPGLDPAFGGPRKSQDFNGEKTEPVIIMLDVTGSNKRDAETVQQRLPQLLGLLTVQGWVKGHLNLQFIGVGDATEGDQFPIQITPFESDGETLDKWLNAMILEGGGGPSQPAYEDYLLAMYAATTNEMDVTKRGGKANLFIIFDEHFRDTLPRRLIEKMYKSKTTIADRNVGGIQISPAQAAPTQPFIPERDLTATEVIGKLKSMYNVTCIVCGKSPYYGDQDTQDQWRSAFGPQSVIKLDDSNNICEMIAAVLGSTYGVATDTIKAELTPLTSSKSLATIDAVITGKTISKTGAVKRL